MLTADYRLLKYILCYFHYRVLPIIQTKCSETLHSIQTEYHSQVSLNSTLVSLLMVSTSSQ